MFTWVLSRLRNRPIWLTPELEKLVDTSLNRPYNRVPMYASPAQESVCKAVVHLISGDSRWRQRLFWSGPDGFAFVDHLVQLTFGTKNSTHIPHANPEALAIFEGVRRVFTNQGYSSIPVDPLLVQQLAVCAFQALQHEKYETIDWNAYERALDKLLQSLLIMLRLAVQENRCFVYEDNKPRVGSLELPAWFMHKYALPPTA